MFVLGRKPVNSRVYHIVSEPPRNLHTSIWASQSVSQSVSFQISAKAHCIQQITNAIPHNAYEKKVWDVKVAHAGRKHLSKTDVIFGLEELFQEITQKVF